MPRTATKRRPAKSERRRRYPQAEPAMPGRPPDRLKIEGGWTEAVRRALKKGKPA
jgi:hypothetical protein